MKSISNPLALYFEKMQGHSDTITWKGHKVRLFKRQWGEMAIAEQGAQVLHYRPKGTSGVLWLSRQVGGPGQAIRGGIPICWPWFGAHPSQANEPNHGPARNNQWALNNEYHSDEQSSWVLDAPEILEGVALQVVIIANYQELNVQLYTSNNSDKEIGISQALHSYLQLSDLSNIKIQGPDSKEFYDKLSDKFCPHEKHQWDQAIDRVYKHKGNTYLCDTELKRTLRIGKTNSHSTVIWNPGIEASIEDIHPDQLSKFICIEAANTREFDPITIQPGEQHSLSTIIELL